MQSEVFEAFRAIDIPEEKALKAATAFGRRNNGLLSFRKELRGLTLMTSFVLVFQLAVFVKLFTL